MRYFFERIREIERQKRNGDVMRGGGFVDVMRIGFNWASIEWALIFIIGY